MTKQEAKKIVAELKGWENVEIKENDYGTIYITAIDPESKQQKTYDPKTGYFE